MELEIVRVALNNLEWFCYGVRYMAIQHHIQTSNERLSWSVRQKNDFGVQFKSLRFTCFAPFPCNPHELADPNLLERVQRLYGAKLAGDHCLICMGSDDDVDSITRCFHIFCLTCFEAYYNNKRQQLEEEDKEVIINCPVCPDVVLGPLEGELASMSTKLKWVINKVPELLNEWNQQEANAAKIVVISSCGTTLTWLNRALSGLGIGSTLYPRYSAETADTIHDFMADPMKRVLLITPRAVQTEIVLPPSSHTIVTEAIVWDVKDYIFRKIKTVGDDTLFKTILVAENTVEEQIILEPHFDDYYNSYDEHCRFVGPRFKPQTNVERIASLFGRTVVPVLDFNDLDLEGGVEVEEGWESSSTSE